MRLTNDRCDPVQVYMVDSFYFVLYPRQYGQEGRSTPEHYSCWSRLSDYLYCRECRQFSLYCRWLAMARKVHPGGKDPRTTTNAYSHSMPAVRAPLVFSYIMVYHNTPISCVRRARVLADNSLWYLVKAKCRFCTQNAAHRVALMQYYSEVLHAFDWTQISVRDRGWALGSEPTRPPGHGAQASLTQHTTRPDPPHPVRTWPADQEAQSASRAAANAAAGTGETGAASQSTTHQPARG